MDNQYREWLLSIQPLATENDIDIFHEKMAGFMENYGMNERKARDEAHFMMIGIYF